MAVMLSTKPSLRLPQQHLREHTRDSRSSPLAINSIVVCSLLPTSANSADCSCNNERKNGADRRPLEIRPLSASKTIMFAGTSPSSGQI